MYYKTFKNFRAARRHLEKIELNILAVDRCLKPSYLWDCFDAEVDEIKNYIHQLTISGKLENELSVVSIKDHVFITCLQNLENHLQLVLDSYYDIFVIDVSKERNYPVPLQSSEKETILRLIINNFYKYSIQDYLKIPETDFNADECNLTTLFGLLLGYPVLYWYDCTESDRNDDLTCLSMLPLKVHKVFASINSSCFSSSRRPLLLHELYSFSIPDMFSQSNKLINTWLEKIQVSKSDDCIFKDLKMICDIVTLPYVVL